MNSRIDSTLGSAPLFSMKSAASATVLGVMSSILIFLLGIECCALITMRVLPGVIALRITWRYRQ